MQNTFLVFAHAERFRKLFDGDLAVLFEQAKDILLKRDMTASGSTLTDRYHASDLSENFIAMTDKLFEGTDFKIKFVKLED